MSVCCGREKKKKNYIINDFCRGGFIFCLFSQTEATLGQAGGAARIPALRQPRLSAMSRSIFSPGTSRYTAAIGHWAIRWNTPSPSAFYICFAAMKRGAWRWEKIPNPRLQFVLYCRIHPPEQCDAGWDFITSKRLINRIIMSVGSPVSGCSRGT